jgi:hypothetical protein
MFSDLFERGIWIALNISSQLLQFWGAEYRTPVPLSAKKWAALVYFGESIFQWFQCDNQKYRPTTICWQFWPDKPLRQ